MTTFIDPSPWNEDAKSWDTIEIAGKVWPGIATVDVVRANKWDTKKTKGTHGGEREFNGADLAKVKIQIRCWTTAQMFELNELLPTIEPKVGKEKPDSVTISHPISIMRQCLLVTIDQVSGPKISDGIVTLDIDCTEYLKPIEKNATGGAGGGSGFKPLALTGSAKCDTLIANLNNRQSDAFMATSIRNKILSDSVNGNYEDGATQNARLSEADANWRAAWDRVVQAQAELNSGGCAGIPPSGTPETTSP